MFVFGSRRKAEPLSRLSDEVCYFLFLKAPVVELSCMFMAGRIETANKQNIFIARAISITSGLDTGSPALHQTQCGASVFRVAISNNRILKLEKDRVTFRYRDTDSGAEKYCTLDAEDFIHRFLQHILPKGFVKVRYYGLFSPGKRQSLSALRQRLSNNAATFLTPTESLEDHSQSTVASPPTKPHLCPNCGHPMQPGPILYPTGLSPP